MMFVFPMTFCCFVILELTSAELVLKTNVKEIITFDGAELEIMVDNSRGVEGLFTLCIKSTGQTSPECPTGYKSIVFKFGYSMVKTFKMNRQGNVMMGTEAMNPIQSISFTEDGALGVILKEVPDQSTMVKLSNAHRYVIPEPTTLAILKKSNSMTTFSVVVIGLLVIAGLSMIAMIVLMCYCRKKTPEKVKQSDDRVQKHKITKTLKDDRHSSSLPPKLKSPRTSSTTVTTTTMRVKSSSAVVDFPVANIQSKSLMTTVKPTPLPNGKEIPPASPFDNNSFNNRTNESASFSIGSGRRSKSALRRPSSHH